jgi:tetratricopeptide (TPR) repeat protein
MSLRCSGLPAVQRADLWARLAAFFARIVPPGDPRLGRLREKTLNARVNAEDTSRDVVEKLLEAYQRHARTDGRDAYLTSVARANLAIAYCQRGTGTDLAEAVRLCRQEIQTRTDRYGADHPITLVARSLLVRCLLAQAEVTEDQGERLRLAREALGDADRVRAARDRLFGVLSVNATLSRRYQGHALFLLGDTERARACLQYALAFDTARNGNREWRGSGHTHLLLARVHRALGDRQAALTHARNARRLLAADTPAGPSRRAAEALLRDLERGS